MASAERRPPTQPRCALPRGAWPRRRPPTAARTAACHTARETAAEWPAVRPAGVRGTWRFRARRPPRAGVLVGLAHCAADVVRVDSDGAAEAIAILRVLEPAVHHHLVVGGG